MQICQEKRTSSWHHTDRWPGHLPDTDGFTLRWETDPVGTQSGFPAQLEALLGFSSGFLIDSMQLKYILGYFYQNENEVIYIVYYLNKIETQNGHYCYQYMLLHLIIMKTNFVWGVALIAVFRWYYLIYLWCRAHVSGPMCCLRAFQGSQHLVNMQ